MQRILISFLSPLLLKVFLKVLDWGIEGPKGKPLEKVREIRDEIERKIKELVEEIGKEKYEIVDL